MLAIQSNIAKYHCLYIQGAVAFQTPGIFFDSPGSLSKERSYRRILIFARSFKGLTVLSIHKRALSTHVKFSEHSDILI